MTLFELTGHEAGIIVYGDNTVGVFNWGTYDDNQIPILSPIGFPMAWPEPSDVFGGFNETYSDDFRSEIPGSIWIEDGEVATDLDIVYDENNDLLRLFLENLDADEYNGHIFTLKDGRKIIAPLTWN